MVLVEPLLIPKKSLMVVSTERVDTRVLQVIDRINSNSERPFVGQRMDAFVSADNGFTPPDFPYFLFSADW